MSLLRQVPEFLKGLEAVHAGQWSIAAPYFSRSGDIFVHSNRAKEAAFAELYSGTCEYYSGNSNRAHSLFRGVRESVASSGGMVSVAARLMIATQPLDASSPPTSGELSFADQLGEGAFVNSLNEFVASGGKSVLPRSETILEENAVCHALLAVASRRVGLLPIANPDGRSSDAEVHLVGRALKAAETFGKHSAPEIEIIKRWYIGRSLILRGRLFEFNGNALMAEGMYQAAIEQSNKQTTPRLRILQAMSSKALGGLLRKWEKRENEGTVFIDSSSWLSTQAAEAASNRIILEPTFQELMSLELS